MIKLSVILCFVCCVGISFQAKSQTAFKPEELVNPLMGTDSKMTFSNGNTYPAVALPWGMNFWTPQTNTNGQGWQYQYSADKIRGFKQTHQPSPWIGDYGQFSIMPMTGKLRVNEEKRASTFSHKAEVAHPYYYSVYLADYNVLTEIAPTERAAYFQFTFPKSDSSYILVDAYDRGSYVKIIPEENKIIGYSTRNRGGVPANFRNYFVLQFDKPFQLTYTVKDSVLSAIDKEVTHFHAQAVVGFKTSKGEKVNVRVASSFISLEQAELNLKKEIGNQSFQHIQQQAKGVWHRELAKVKAEGGTTDQLKTFYFCLYRMILFPRKLHEINAANEVVHYSPFNGNVEKGFMYTDTGFWDTFRALFPFLSIVYPETDAQIMEGLTNTYKESGWLPEWASPGHKKSMIGNNSASVVGEAYQLMGGRKKMEMMLDSVFQLPPIFEEKYYKRVIHEMTEMQVMNVGQYAHGNQPIQHMLYIYNYCGAPWKAQFHVRDALDKLYKPTPDGYCGDEDNGQTSAWYVFSAISFYPVCPGSQEYVIGSPLFRKVTLKLQNGKQFTIKATNNDEQRVYVQSATLNGKPLTKNFVTHSTLINGGTLDFDMTATPNYKRGVGTESEPFSATK